MKKIPRILLSQNLSVDNALSTIQLIHQIVSQINTLADEVNNIDTKANEYTDNEVEKLNEELRIVIDNLSDALRGMIDINSNKINKINSELIDINVELKKLGGDIKSNTSSIESNFKTLLLLMQDLKNYVEDLITEMTVKVYSPVDGTKKDIQSILVELMNLYQRDFGNVTLGYVKKLFNQQLYVNDTLLPLTEIKFLSCKDLKLDNTYLTLFHGDEYYSITFYQKFRDSRIYSFYQLINIIGIGVKEIIGDVEVTDIYKAIGNILYSIFGWYYTVILPKNKSW